MPPLHLQTQLTNSTCESSAGPAAASSLYQSQVCSAARVLASNRYLIHACNQVEPGPFRFARRCSSGALCASPVEIPSRSTKKNVHRDMGNFTTSCTTAHSEGLVTSIFATCVSTIQLRYLRITSPLCLAKPMFDDMPEK